MHLRILIIAPLLTAGLFTGAAQAAEVELSLMAGFRTGTTQLLSRLGCPEVVGIECPEVADVENDISVGLTLDVALGSESKWWFEGIVNRHTSPVLTDQIICPECDAFFLQYDDFQVDTLQVGIHRRFLNRPVQPFLGLAAGVSRVDGGIHPIDQAEIDESGASASLSAGLLVAVNDRLSVRIEARSYHMDLSEEFFVDDYQENELAGGVTFRF